MEGVLVPIIDLKKAHSYTHFQVDKPYIALNTEVYISLRHQELRTCKNIGYEFYCKEFFIIKCKSKYSCESATYFKLGSEIIKENCNFSYYFNKTAIKPAVFDGGNEIILANWPNNKHVECNVNNNKPVRIPSFSYVLLNRNVLCNCEINMENHFLLESLEACQERNFKLMMYFMVNVTFINYFDNLTNSLKFQILLNQTTYEHTLLISLQLFYFDPDLPKSPKPLKEFIYQFQHKKENFDFWKMNNINDLEIAKKIPFLIIKL